MHVALNLCQLTKSYEKIYYFQVSKGHNFKNMQIRLTGSCILHVVLEATKLIQCIITEICFLSDDTLNKFLSYDTLNKFLSDTDDT